MSKLETNTIDNISGSSTLTIGDSNASTISIPKNITLGASGTTITVPSGATITNNGTQTGFGGANTPAFLVRKSGDQTGISANTWTKVTGWVEIFDTDNKFVSNGFTPGEVGKYFIFGTALGGSVSGLSTDLSIYLNGARVEQVDHVPADTGNFAQQISCIVNVTSVTDYIEFYINLPTGTVGTVYSRGIANQFGGYKLIT